MWQTEIPSGDAAPGEIYRSQLAAIMTHGLRTDVGGRPTRELLNVVTNLAPGGRRLAVTPGRRLNPFLALSESLWLLAGRNDVTSLLPFNQNITRFSDNGKTLYGAYGRRIADQIDPLVERLKRQPTDRRGVLSIWRPEDLTADTKDPPCNDLLFFKLREGALHMTVCNRSNDLHWGLWAVNVPEFWVLQEYLAARLGVIPGDQVHLSNSLHIYIDAEGMRITGRMVDASNEPVPELERNPGPLFSPDWYDVEHHASCKLTASWALDGTDDSFKEPFFQFAFDYLNVYREKKRHFKVEDIVACRHSEKYPEWVLAAVNFHGSF